VRHGPDIDPGRARRPLFDDPPVVIGHRGAGQRPDLVENTVDAVRAAVDAGARWVEIDVRRTADDVLVVLHDPRTTGGEFVAEVARAEPPAARLPELSAVLDAVPDDIGVDIDVKTSLEDAVRPPERSTAGLLAPIVAAEAEHRKRLLVTSFDPSALIHLKSVAPGVPLGLLTWFTFPLRKAIPAARHLGLDALVAHTGSFIPDPDDAAAHHHDIRYAVDVAHRAGIEVAAWCPTPADAVRLADGGVDAVVVNDLTGTTKALAEWSERR
jgi:glycerophosphoryl diester phosphodiesterase